MDATGRGQAVGPKDRGRAAAQARAGRRPVPPVLAAGHGQVGQHRERRVSPAYRAHGRRRTGRLLARRAIAERQGGLLRRPGGLRRHGPATRALAEDQVRNGNGEENIKVSNVNRLAPPHPSLPPSLYIPITVWHGTGSGTAVNCYDFGLS